MRTQLLTRRQLLQLGGSASLLAAIGCGRNTVDTASEALIRIGSMTFQLPHSVAKVLGISFVVAGSCLKVIATTLKNEKETFRIKLDKAAREEVSKAITQGEHATVVYLGLDGDPGQAGFVAAQDQRVTVGHPEGRKETVMITMDDEG
jgi:hypothetical protein